MDLEFIKELGKELKAAGIESDEDMEAAIVAEVEELDLDVDDFDVEYDDGTATLFGVTADQDTLEKTLVAVGNLKGVLKVVDELELGETESERAAIAEAEAAARAQEREERVAELKQQIEAARAAKEHEERVAELTAQIEETRAAKAKEERRKERKEERAEQRRKRANRRKRIAARRAAGQAARKESETVFYTVVSGDTLGKIADAHYGDWSKYPVIFEANTPMLKNPDLIYPGQVLRIPALD